MLNCKCEIAPIVRHINSALFDGQRNIFLDQYSSQLKCEGALGKANDCLKSHGFSGCIQFLDDRYIYCDEV